MATWSPRANDIFLDALEFESPVQRRSFVERTCGDDAELRDQVVSLLEASQQAGDFLESPPCGFDVMRLNCSGSLIPGDTIGPYKLREQIGEGGMGIVYVAEQTEPLRRKVALKVIKPGMDSKEVLARFEAEKQALALMDHPHVARVIDAGTTRQGRPYFVMELVRGLPITEYCDGAQLDTRARLELFLKVCQGVQHAHLKGIIHRDLKPSNVLVTVSDGAAVPKVIDFGVAKALHQKLTDETIYTQFRQMIGTPAYMSPEQAELSSLDVDTRSDVYSLGVLLYELLTGTTPFDKETLKSKTFDEMRRIIREQDPPRPSHRISTLDAAAQSTLQERRGIDARQLSQSLKHELDWIVMKALEKNLSRRYQSPSELAEDIERYVANRPIVARRPSLFERARKWVARNRMVAVLAVTLMFAVLMASTAVSVMLTRREVRPPSSPFPAPLSLQELAARPAVRGKVDPLDRPVLSGLVPAPRPLDGVGRWQMISRVPRSFVHHNWSLAWSPDSRFLAFGDGMDVRVYRIPDFELVHVLSGHTNSVVSVDWSPDGEMIASASADNTVRLWDARSGVPGPVLIGHRSRVNSVAWHPNSQQLASASRDQTVRLWGRGGTAGPILDAHTSEVMAVAWSPDGARLASGGDRTIRGTDRAICIWTASGQLERVIDEYLRVRSIAWSPDGGLLLTSNFTPNLVRVWNLEGQGVMTLEGHQNHVTSASWSPDGSRIASSSWDKTVRLWSSDGTPGPVLRGHESDVYSVKWSPDGKWMASGGLDYSIRLWREDGQPGPSLIGTRPISRAAWSPDGRHFAVAVRDGTVRLCSVSGIQTSVLEKPSSPVTSVDWNPGGDQLVTGHGDGSITVWDLPDGTSSISYQGHPRHVVQVTWSPAGDRFVSASGVEATLRFWQRDGTPGAELIGHRRSQLYSVAWSPRGERLASVGIDGTVRLWSEDGSPLAELHVGQLLASVAWRPDGSALASGCEDGTIQLWHADGRPDRMLRGHEDRITCIDWSRDGQWLASGSRDTHVRLWSSSGEPRMQLTGHNNPVSDVRWLPGSHQLLSCSHDATVRLWNIDTGGAEWVLVVLPGKESLTLSREGTVRAGDSDVFEREFAYIVEQPSGAMKILSPAQFEQLRVRTKPADTPNGRHENASTGAE